MKWVNRGLVNRVYEAYWELVRYGDCGCPQCTSGPYWEWFNKMEGRTRHSRKLHFTLKEMCELLGYDYEKYKDRMACYAAVHAAIDHFYTRPKKDGTVEDGLASKYYDRSDVSDYVEEEIVKGRSETEVMEEVWNNGFIPWCMTRPKPWIPLLGDGDTYYVPDYPSFVLAKNEQLRKKANMVTTELRARRTMGLPPPDGSKLILEAHDMAMGYLEVAGASLTEEERRKFSLPSPEELDET